MERGDIGEVVIKMGLDLIVFQRKFGRIFPRYRAGRGGRDDDIRLHSLQLRAFPGDGVISAPGDFVFALRIDFGVIDRIER